MKRKKVEVMMPKREAGMLIDIWMSMGLPFNMTISRAVSNERVFIKIHWYEKSI